MKLRYRKRRTLGAVLAYYRRVEAMGFTRIANVTPAQAREMSLDGVLGSIERVTFITSPLRRTHAGKPYHGPS